MIDYQVGKISFRVNFSIIGEKPPTMDEICAVAINEYLKAYNFNHSRAAKALGINRLTLRSKCRKYGIKLPKDKE